MCVCNMIGYNNCVPKEALPMSNLGDMARHMRMDMWVRIRIVDIHKSCRITY